MAQAYLLTGEPGVGKTTALKKIIDGIGPERCGGFYAEELLDQSGKHYGFKLVTLGEQVVILAHTAMYSTYCIGRYRVSVQALELGVAAINNALLHKEFVIIDEIGPMQMCSLLFKLAVMDVLNSSVPLIGTIHSDPHPWSDKLKQRGDVKLYPLTVENRGEVTKTLTETLSSMQNTP